MTTLRLVSWAKYNRTDHDLTVMKMHTPSFIGRLFGKLSHEEIATYRGFSSVFYNTETGWRADWSVERALEVFLRRIKWGEFQDLEVKK